MELTSIILLVLVILLLYSSINLLRKVENLEDIIEKYDDHLKRLNNVITESDKYLKDLDSRGIFQGDDEVGEFFENMKNVQETINRFKI